MYEQGILIINATRCKYNKSQSTSSYHINDMTTTQQLE